MNLNILGNGEDYSHDADDKIKQINPDLSDLEKSVMFEKHTERAFTGEYDDFYDTGDFACKNCGVLLYSSTAKFNAGCGWPAFDDCYPDAIQYNQDPDGRRVEIVCNNCKIHLGHVFEGEHLTDKNTRHCVNSVSVKFVKREEKKENIKELVLGCGCFWGVEFYLKKLEGVVGTMVGYSGGEREYPDYEDVCTGKSGHYEVVKVTYDSTKLTFEDLVKYFFEIHNFEQEDGQGNDIGEQYQSVIFYANVIEQNKAQNVIDELIDMDYNVATRLLPAKSFYEGELYHQDYYEKNGHLPYCHTYKKIFGKESL
jgi:peptide methionine sulfoxide reductase msrA/msrB